MRKLLMIVSSAAVLLSLNSLAYAIDADSPVENGESSNPSVLTCADVVKELSSLREGKSSPNMEVFQTLEGFTQTLGEGTVTTSSTYKWKQWPNYTLTAGEKGTSSTSGSTPPPLGALKTPEQFIFIPTVEQANQALGTPDSTTVDKEYTWTCPSEQGKFPSIIQVKVDASNKIINYSGNCGYSDCASSSIMMPGDQIALVKATASTPQIEPNAIAAYQENQAAKLLKSEFNLDVQGRAQSETAVTNLLTNYYAALQKCTAGSYKYLVPNMLAGYAGQSTKSVPENLIPPTYILKQATIQGTEGNLCVVKGTVFMPAMMSPTAKDEEMAEDCQFKSEDLAVFTPEEAQFIGKGNVDTTRPAAKVWGSSCKIPQ